MNHKLPNNLPPFPEVPSGFVAWVYRGLGYSSSELCTYAYWSGDAWYVRKGFPSGSPDVHYLVAVTEVPLPPAPENKVRLRMDSAKAGPALVLLLTRLLRDAGAEVTVDGDEVGLPDKVESLKGLHVYFDRPTWVREEEAERW